MRGIWMASLALALTLSAGNAFAWCGSGYNYNCNINDPTFAPKFDTDITNKVNNKITNTVANTQSQQQQQQQGQQQKSVNKNENYNAGNTQSTTFEDRLQAPSISVNAPGLAALAASECVLSNTTSAGAGVSVAGLGIAGAFGTGNTHPYDECNTRAAIQVLGQLGGTIQGVDVKVIIGNMAASLTNVQAAIDKAKGVQPTTTSSTSATPAAIAPQQTASASPAPYCNANWPTVIKLAHGCQ